MVGRMDRVLVDAPCSGTGVWRRRPDTKWRLTADSLKNRTAEQDSALRDGARYVRPGGILAYATCSLLPVENEERIAAFLNNCPEFEPISVADAWASTVPGGVPPPLRGPFLVLTPQRSHTDGFFLALLRRRS